jgi:hypothetical protein
LEYIQLEVNSLFFTQKIGKTEYIPMPPIVLLLGVSISDKWILIPGRFRP